MSDSSQHSRRDQVGVSGGRAGLLKNAASGLWPGIWPITAGVGLASEAFAWVMSAAAKGREDALEATGLAIIVALVLVASTVMSYRAAGRSLAATVTTIVLAGLGLMLAGMIIASPLNFG